MGSSDLSLVVSSFLSINEISLRMGLLQDLLQPQTHCKKLFALLFLLCQKTEREVRE